MPIRSRWKDQFEIIEGNSKFHNKVREFFVTDDILRSFRAFQEVPVKDLVEDYPYTHFFDWYVEELNLVVELHGAQHYKVVNFGNVSYEQAQEDFKSIKRRDKRKREAALEAGYFYLEISYKQYAKLTSEKLKELLFGVVQ